MLRSLRRLLLTAPSKQNFYEFFCIYFCLLPFVYGLARLFILTTFGLPSGVPSLLFALYGSYALWMFWSLFEKSVGYKGARCLTWVNIAVFSTLFILTSHVLLFEALAVNLYLLMSKLISPFLSAL